MGVVWDWDCRNENLQVGLATKENLQVGLATNENLQVGLARNDCRRNFLP